MISYKVLLRIIRATKKPFPFFNFISTKDPSIDNSEITNVEGISTHMYKSIPPSFAFLSNLYEVA